MSEITLISGNLTVSGTFSSSGFAYIPSGYTNQAFTPGGLLLTPLNSGNVLGVGPFTTGFRARYLVPTGTEELSRHIRTQKFELLTGNSLDALIPTNKFNYNTLEAFVPYTSGVGPQFIRAKNYVYTIDERFRHIESSGVFALLGHEKIGIGTFQPTEKVHVGGNLRVAGAINPTIENFNLNLNGSFFPPTITGVILVSGNATNINGSYSQSQAPNALGNSFFTNSNGAVLLFSSGFWYATYGGSAVYRSENLQSWTNIGGGLPVPISTIQYLT